MVYVWLYLIYSKDYTFYIRVTILLFILELSIFFSTLYNNITICHIPFWLYLSQPMNNVSLLSVLSNLF